MFRREVSVWLGKWLPSNMPEMLKSCQAKQPQRQTEDMLASGEEQDLSEEEEEQGVGVVGGCCSTTSICLSQASFNHSRPAQPSPTRSVLFV